MTRSLAIALLATALLGGCAPGSSSPWVGFGPSPTLTSPRHGLLPTVNIAKAVGWSQGAAPQAPAGFTVTRFAAGLDHPRSLYVLPNGDVLAAQSASEPHKAKGFTDWVQQSLQKRAGALQPSPDNIILLRDADGDGVAETRMVFAAGLKRPFGMALVGDRLYVANDDSVVRFPYATGQTAEQGPGEKVLDLPGGPINHHWTKSLVASRDGTRLYAGVGSNSNVGENGMAAEEGRAAVHELDLATGRSRLLATGLRNPSALAIQPGTDALWAAVNERDELGNDLVPDYMTRVRDGAFYGWPYSYYGQHVDVRPKPQRPDLVARAVAPDYGLGPHTASLGLAFYDQAAFPAHYRGGVFVSQHGSWNRRPLNGYRVVFIPFAAGAPAMPPEAFLTGFLNDRGQAQGRPVGLAIDKAGALLVADDAGDAVWRVAPARPAR